MSRCSFLLLFVSIMIMAVRMKPRQFRKLILIFLEFDDNIQFKTADWNLWEVFILKKMKKVLGMFGLAVLAIAVLWGTGIVPKSIGRHTAAEYVQENYSEMGLKFETIEFSTAYGDYIASFIGGDDTVYNFRLSSGPLPVSVVYDSIKQSIV